MFIRIDNNRGKRERAKASFRLDKVVVPIYNQPVGNIYMSAYVLQSCASKQQSPTYNLISLAKNVKLMIKLCTE